MLALNSDLNALASIIIELILGTTYEQVEESYVSFLKSHYTFVVQWSEFFCHLYKTVISGTSFDKTKPSYILHRTALGKKHEPCFRG